MELPIGFEPMNRGFAIRRLTILAKEAKWGQRLDSNQRFPSYEHGEMTDFSTLLQKGKGYKQNGGGPKKVND